MSDCIYNRGDDIDIAAIEGRLTQKDGETIRQLLMDRIAAGSRKMVLNLAKATYMDSFGLGTLISVQNAIRAKAGRVVLAEPAPVIRSLMELTCVQSLFEIFGDEPAAIAALSCDSAEKAA